MALDTDKLAGHLIIVILVLFVLMLLGRELFNWYIKHNAMLDELQSIRRHSQTQSETMLTIATELRRTNNEIVKQSGRGSIAPGNVIRSSLAPGRDPNHF